MKRLMIMAMTLLALTVHVKAVDQSVITEIEEMEFVKAWNYAKAIDLYCFPDRKFAKGELFGAAMVENILRNRLNRTARLIDDDQDIAFKHLAGDQSACQPAERFVTRMLDRGRSQQCARGGNRKDA